MSATELPTGPKLRSMRVGDLRQMLADTGARTEGKKDELVARLLRRLTEMNATPSGLSNVPRDISDIIAKQSVNHTGSLGEQLQHAVALKNRSLIAAVKEKMKPTSFTIRRLAINGGNSWTAVPKEEAVARVSGLMDSDEDSWTFRMANDRILIAVTKHEITIGTPVSNLQSIGLGVSPVANLVKLSIVRFQNNAIGIVSADIKCANKDLMLDLMVGVMWLCNGIRGAWPGLFSRMTMGKLNEIKTAGKRQDGHLDEAQRFAKVFRSLVPAP